mmetsp:Transcript_217/g.254  ORF Transcript_217/g.254 Transcript_217/m.254 type:complete len:306 (+) Transcript_217:78-995(+)
MHRDDDISNPKPANPVEKAASKLIKLIPYNAARPSPAMIIAWGVFLTLSFAVYSFCSDGDFSFLLTYAACCRSFGFFLLNFRMYASKSGSSVSLKSLEAYAFVFGFRLISIMRHEGYLPYDRSGDWFYHVVEFSSFGFALLAIFLLKFRYVASYDEGKDSFGHYQIPSQFGVIYIILPCFILACILKPNLNKDFISDMSWTFSMYLESLAIAPQLFMFTRQSDTPIEVLVAHCVAALGFARVIEMAFWMWSFHELTDTSGSKLVGYFVLIVQFVHVAIMGDFFYFYLASLKKGTPMQLPSTAGIV